MPSSSTHRTGAETTARDHGYGGVQFVLLVMVLAVSRAADARPGTHPIVVSTFDARASSVSLEYRHGFLSGGGTNDVAYTASFSATSGKLSAQFGFHYVNYVASQSDPVAHGISGTATAVFVLPTSSRLDNGLPAAAVSFYTGLAPTALVSGERNYVTLPLVLGVGLPLTPSKTLTVTPWFELAPSVNFDTVINAFSFDPADAAGLIDPVTGQVVLGADDVEKIIAESVELETSVAAGARAGLDLALHVSEAVDLATNATISSIGGAFKGARVFYLGGGFVWRWDDVVPAVLPAEKRLLHENCDDIETRFRYCPNSKRWKSPAAPLSPAACTEPSPAPAPRVPAPLAPAPTAPTPSPAPTAPAAGSSTGTFPP